MIRIVISEVAARSVAEQSDYYYEQSGEELATHWEKEVANTLLSLQAFPERGAKHSWFAQRLTGLRCVPVASFPSHLVFYSYDHVSFTIRIVHVLHRARDLTLIFEDLVQ